METKQCSQCGVEKPLSSFHSCKSCKDGYRTQCRECRSAYSRKRYRGTRHSHIKELKGEQLRSSRERNRQFITEYLSTHPCVDCGEKDPIVLEFDHVRGAKHRDVTYMVTRAHSLETIALEIEKCDVRCANCHRRKTALERGYYRITTYPKPTELPRQTE